MPVQVLHLIDPGTPGGGGCSLRLLAEPIERLRSVHQSVIIIGTREHAALAQRCGVPVVGIISPPANLTPLAHRPLTRAIRALESAQGRFDLIHCWTLSSAMLASLSASTRPRIASLHVGPISGLGTQVLMMMLRHHDLPLIASSSAVEQEYRSLGVRSEQVSLLPPAVNPASVERPQRDDVRQSWGVDDDVLLVGLLSEPVSWGEARIAIDVVARVAATGRRVQLVVHPTATRRHEAERWLERLGFDDLLISADEIAEPWNIVHALDVALFIGGEQNSMDLSGSGSPFAVLTGGGRRLRPMPGILPLLWAMSAGVPVVAEASCAVRDIIEDGRSGLLVDQHDINAAADRIIRIHDDATIAGRIGANARAIVKDRFNISAFCARLREIYQRVADGHHALTPAIENEPEPVIEHESQRTTLQV